MGSEALSCPVCGTAGPELFLEIPGVPVQCNRLWPSRESARAAPREDLRLAFCRGCTHIFNAAFLPERMEYGGEYENSLHFSPNFQEYSRSLADYLVERFALRDNCVLEIGCGKGEFLAQLVTLGAGRGIGFDPSFQPGRVPAEAAARMQVFRQLFSPGPKEVEADFICCRHVLEHLPEPVAFLTRLRHAGRDRMPVFFEVPNALFMLRDLGIWDLIYEHPSYFGPTSLRRTFAAAGFEVLSIREAFAGQFLWLEAAAAPEGSAVAAGETEEHLEPMIDRFRERFAAQLAGWRDTLATLRRLGRRAVVWGAGSKGVSFLTFIPAGEEMIGAVDVNPHKQGTFVAGTGHPVLAPESLSAHAPDVVIVMNPVYRREIEQSLERLGLFPELLIA